MNTKIDKAILRKIVANWIFILPLVILLLLLIFLPLCKTFWLSFHKTFLDGRTQFIGLSNYWELLSSPDFSLMMKNTILWVIGGILIKVIGGLGVALVLNRSFRGKNIFMLIVLLPWATPYVISAVTWKWIYEPLFGQLNDLLLRLSIINGPVEWLGSPQKALWCVLFIHSWTGIPFCAFVILSGLYGIPKDYYEVAMIEGAGSFRTFWSVTFPLLKPTLALLTVITGIWGFNAFEMIFVTTGGGPLLSSEILITYAYKNAFSFRRPGFASAVATTGLILMLFFSIVYILNRKKLYESITT